MKLLKLCLLLFPLTAVAQDRPNILYIMSDDHDANAISAYNPNLTQTPHIDRLAKEGMLFERSFVANSLCGPARATILTGEFSHKNGFYDNRSRFDGTQVTLPKLLKEVGYQTAIIGKWHLVTYPTGFDYWKIVPGQGQYYEPAFIDMNGDTSITHGYATTAITDAALDWLKDKRDPSKPFFLMLHHKAPHRNFMPTLDNIRRFRDKQFPEPPTLFEDTAGHGTAWRLQTMSILRDMQLSSDLKVDPSYLMDIPWLKPAQGEINYYNAIMKRLPADTRQAFLDLYKYRGETIKRLRPSGKELMKLKFQWYMEDYMACVASVDENVGRVLDYLDKSGLSKNTIVVYTSDQGFYLGENGWFDKRWMYDVSMRSPLLIRWPGHITPNTHATAMVQNIDYAPTFLDILGIKAPASMQGLSFKSVLQHPEEQMPRKSLYYHFYEFHADHSVLEHIGVRTDRYKLMYFYTVNEWQLFDLQKDPVELHNLVNDPAYKQVLSDMKAELNRQKTAYADPIPEGKLE